MSPVNSDDSSGDALGGAGRPLTRKEIRAREKLLATQGQSVIPPQAFETGPDAPTAPPAPSAGTGPSTSESHTAEAPAAQVPKVQTPPVQTPPADQRFVDAPEARTPVNDPPQAAPDLPDAAPTVHKEPVHTERVHKEPVHTERVHKEPVPDVPADEEPVREDFTQLLPVHKLRVREGAGQEDAAREDTARGDAAYVTAGVHGFRQEAGAHDAGTHNGYARHPHDEAHYAYSDSGEHYAQPEADAQYHGDPAPELTGGTKRPDKVASKKTRRRRRFLALVLTLTVFVVAIAVGAQFLKPLLGGDSTADYPGPGTGEVIITVQPGAGPKSVATELEAKKVVASADTFLKEFAASGGALNPGTFTMRQEMKNSDAVAVLLNKDKDKVMYFALSAGLRINESLQAISEGTGISAPELKALSDAPTQFGVPAKAKNLEGYLAPGEYRFPLGTSAKDIVQKLVSTTLDELKAQGVTDPAKQYDVVTVASIVQAEGGQAEYGDVAGAIYNRLKPDNTETNGLIQSDATVTYGLGIRSFHIDEAQKADKSNLYNTYANQGLPVGPIGSPGKTAIDAAAKPKSNSYLYWVTINLDTKETKFSKTLAEHNGYVEQYNAWCEANPGRCV